MAPAQPAPVATAVPQLPPQVVAQPTAPPATLPPTNTPIVVVPRQGSAISVWPTPVLRATPTPEPTLTPTPAPTPTPTPTPEPTATPTPTPTAAPTPTPTPEPTATPTAAPTFSPTVAPTLRPAPPRPVGGYPLEPDIQPLGDNLLWIAHFNNATKTWAVFDRSSTFSPDMLPVPAFLAPTDLSLVNFLDTLKVGDVYYFAVSQAANLQLGGKPRELDQGVSHIVW